MTGTPLPTDDCGSPATRAAERLAMLRELAQIGMGLARDVARRAQAPGAAAGDLGLAYGRIARAVRQTLALETRLEDGIEVRRREDRAAHELQAARLARRTLERRTKLVRRAVGQAIEAEAEDADRVEYLIDRLDERLDDRQDDEDFLDRPLGELVARICKDLGVTVDLNLWEDEDWARPEAAAPPPPSGEAGPALTLGPEPPTPAEPPRPAHPCPAGAPSWLSG